MVNSFDILILNNSDIQKFQDFQGLFLIKSVFSRTFKAWKLQNKIQGLSRTRTNPVIALTAQGSC